MAQLSYPYMATGKTIELFIIHTWYMWHSSASWEICMLVKKQQLEPDMEQWTDSKSGKEYVNAVYAEHIMLNARLDEAQAGIKIARKNINNLRYADNTTIMAETKRN